MMHMTIEQWGGLLLVGAALLGLFGWYDQNRAAIEEDLDPAEKELPNSDS